MVIISLVIILILFFGCTSSPRYKSTTSNKIKKNSSSKVVFTKPSNKIPYYDKNKKTIKGISSFYGLNDGFHGKLTANGEVFDMNKLTCAHKFLPFNTVLKVTNEDNGKSVVVRVNDRGPFIRGRDLDISYAAAKEIGLIGVGVKQLKVEVLESPKDE